VSSLWKFVKRPELLLRGACEVVLEHAISGVVEKLTIRRSGYIFVSMCLGYLYNRFYFLVIAFKLEVIYILFITCEIYLVLSCLDSILVGALS
jgi:hypothetical protein